MKTQFIKDLLKEKGIKPNKKLFKILNIERSDYRLFYKKKVIYITIKEARELCDYCDISINDLNKYSINIVQREDEEYQNFKTKIFEYSLKILLFTVIALLFIQGVLNNSEENTFALNIQLALDALPFLTIIILLQQNYRNKQSQKVQFEIYRKQKEAKLILRLDSIETKSVYKKVTYELHNVGASSAYNINFKITSMNSNITEKKDKPEISKINSVEPNFIIKPYDKIEIPILYPVGNDMCYIEISFNDMSTLTTKINVYNNEIKGPYIQK